MSVQFLVGSVLEDMGKRLFLSLKQLKHPIPVALYNPEDDL